MTGQRLAQRSSSASTDASCGSLPCKAHGVNLDLGWALRIGLATVDPQDMLVARFFVAAALGGDYHGGYGTAGEKAKQLAMSAIRPVIEAFRIDVTKTGADGCRGASRVDYGD